MGDLCVERRKKNMWFDNHPMATTPAYGIERHCGFCGLNLLHMPSSDSLSASIVLDKAAAQRLHFKEYCSEYCVIQDAMLHFGQQHKAAFIARMQQNRPHWLSDTFNSISLRRGERWNQTMPASVNENERKQARGARRDTESMQM